MADILLQVVAVDVRRLNQHSLCTRLRIYTGARAGELAALRWGDVDRHRRLITIHRSFDGPTKSRDVRHIPILDPLMPILARWRLRTPGTLLFPNRVGRMHAPSARIFQENLHAVLDTARFPKVRRRDREARYVTFHGLRHTFASHWVMGGGDLFKLQKIGGWRSFEMVQRYAHLAPGAFAEDYARLGPAEQHGEVCLLPVAADGARPRPRRSRDGGGAPGGLDPSSRGPD